MKRTIFAVIVIPSLTAIFTLRLLNTLDVINFDFSGDSSRFSFPKDVSPKIKNEHCKVLKTDNEYDIGSEDIVHYRDRIFLFGTGDMWNLLEHGVDTAKQGGIVMVDLKDKNRPVIKKLKLEGLPKDRVFHAHGIYYSKITKRLFVVNHSGQKGLLSVVEVFNVGEDLKSRHPFLTYQGFINGGFPHAFINDVIEGGKNEIYITNWNLFPIPLDGTNSVNVSFMQKLKNLFYLLSNMMAIQDYSFTSLYYCSFTDKNLTESKKNSNVGVNADCTVVRTGFVGANGVTINDNRTIIFVNDPTPKTVSVFKRKELGEGKLGKEVDLIGRIPLVDTVDNIEYHSETGGLTGGGFPLLYSHLERSWNSNSLIPGSMVLVEPKFDGTTVTGKSKRLMYHDGSLLSQLSSCVIVDSETVLCGSPFDVGVLMCSV